MNDEGYVLSDTLAGLAIIGLAMGGMLAGVTLLAQVQGRTDREIARIAELKRASVALGDLLGRAGPFRTRDSHFDGAPQAFDFACGTQRCGARLETVEDKLLLQVTRASGELEAISLRDVQAAHFTYVGGITAGDTWPRPTARPDRLRQVTLVDASGETLLAQAALPVDQPMICEFDVVSQDCR